MNSETLAQLDLLAQKFGTTIEYILSVYQKQAIVELTWSLIFMLITILSSIFLVKFYRKLDDSMNEERDSIIMWIWGIINLIMIFVVIVIIDNIITYIFNPEYWAIQHLISTFKPN